MSFPCALALIVLVAIIIGLKFKINLGILGLVSAYLCGSVIGGLSASSILGLWPISVMTQVICIMLFFSVAMNNGTFKVLADKMIYSGRKVAPLIPFLLYLAIFVVAAVGTGSTAVYIMALPIYLVAKQVKIKPGFFPIIIISGLNGGAWQIFSRDGAMAGGILADSGFAAEEAAAISSKMGLHYFLTSLVLFAVGYVIFRGWKCEALVTEKPEPFTKQQKITLGLVGAFIAVYLIPTILGNFITSDLLTAVNLRINLFMLACVFALICILLKLSTIKEMIDSVPWMALITVGGMGTFISVCNKLGLVDFLSTVISNNISVSLVPSVLAICAGFMSLFSATMGVVLPTFYPIAYSLAGSMGISPALMVSAISIGSGMSGISPFSSMGAVTYSVVGEKDKKAIFTSEILTVAIAYLVVQACILVGLYTI